MTVPHAGSERTQRARSRPLGALLRILAFVCLGFCIATLMLQYAWRVQRIVRETYHIGDADLPWSVRPVPGIGGQGGPQAVVQVPKVSQSVTGTSAGDNVEGNATKIPIVKAIGHQGTDKYHEEIRPRNPMSTADSQSGELAAWQIARHRRESKLGVFVAPAEALGFGSHDQNPLHHHKRRQEVGTDPHDPHSSQPQQPREPRQQNDTNAGNFVHTLQHSEQPPPSHPGQGSRHAGGEAQQGGGEAWRQEEVPAAGSGSGGRWGDMRAAAARAAGATGGARVPHILHQTGPSLDRMREAQRSFHEECRRIYAEDGWIHHFWTDVEMNEFVQSEHPDLHSRWAEMEPIIRRVDTARYLWMYTFGGVYLDMDGECIRSAGAFFDGLPPGSTAWSGGYPEPFFMASTPGNPFWLSFVGSVFESWRHKHVRNSSGPQGLQAGLVKWANGNGGPEAVRKFSMSNEKECSIIRPPGDVAHNVATWRWITEPHQLAPGTPPPHEHRIGFIPNQILDPTACKGPLLRDCLVSHCHVKPELQNSGALFVHHCMETWGGHKPQDIQHSSFNKPHLPGSRSTL